jgi:hypothetical protein
MKIELIKDVQGQPIGWDIVPETKEDDVTIATMRDLTFFGVGDTAIKYNGFSSRDEAKGKTIGNIKRLHFLQKIFK